jgi:hypothetical protein
MKPLVLIGDSHLAAIKMGLDLDPAMTTSREVLFHPFGRGGLATTPFFSLSEDATELRTHARGWSNLTLTRDSFRAGTGEGAVIAISLPLNTARVLRGGSWQTHVPWRMQQDDTELPLSDQTLTQIFTDDCANAIAYVRAVAALGFEVIVIEAPRFVEHAVYLHPIRREVCHMIDTSYRGHVRAQLAASGIPVLDQPAGTITPDGTTDAAFRHENPKDNQHANADYGRQVMQALLDRVRSADDPR